MFPKISDLINYLFGTHLNLPIQSYGFMVAMAFVSGTLVLYYELRRKERAGDIRPFAKPVVTGAPASVQELLMSGLFGFLLGWKGTGILLEYSLFLQNPQHYLLSGEGIWWGGIAVAAALMLLTWWNRRKQQLPEPVTEMVTVHPYQLTGSIFLVAAVFGIIGAKLFDTAEHLQDLAMDPWGTLFSFSGLSFYGGLVVAAVAVPFYTERHHIPTPQLADAIAPALILAYAVGRIGCQLSGDGCWGIANEAPMPEWLRWLPSWVWSFTYPHNVIDAGIPLGGCVGEHCRVLPYPVWPTPLYETTMGLIIFGILWMLRKRLPVPGYLFCIYLILNGTERFLIEMIRVNPPYSVFGIRVTQAQIIAIGLVLLGIAGFGIFSYLKRWYNRRDREQPPQTA